MPVTRKAVWCCLALCGLAPAAAAQETRTFPEAECSYTLPKDWDWLDPKTLQASGGKTIVLAYAPRGLRFTVRFDAVPKGERTDAQGLEAFEAGLLKSTRMRKTGSRHITFKGVPAYQIDLSSPEGQGTSIRILYANDKFYHLQVANQSGPLGPEAETDAVFEGFNFTRQPEPPRGPAEDVNVLRGRESAVFLSVCCAGVFAAAVVGLVVYLYRSHNRDAGHADPDDAAS